MADESKLEKSKMIFPLLSINTTKTLSRSNSSMPSSPTGLKKTARNNCLCSPTTHAGSFRCRYHRSSDLRRSSMSVGSKLSELAGKSSDLGITEKIDHQACLPAQILRYIRLRDPTAISIDRARLPVVEQRFPASPPFLPT